MDYINLSDRRHEQADKIERLTNQLLDLDIVLDDQRREAELTERQLDDQRSDIERTERQLSTTADELERANAEYDAIAECDDSDDDDRRVSA